MLAHMLTMGWVVLIDLALSLDNAALISLTARGVSEESRWLVQYTGVFFAVLFRIAFALIAAVFLRYAAFTAVGGLYLLWVCWRMVRDRDAPVATVSLGWSLLGPVMQIVTADLMMSADNVIAVGAIARNNPAALVFGLMLSVSLMMLATELFSRVLRRWPETFYAAVGCVLLTAARMLWESGFARV